MCGKVQVVSVGGNLGAFGGYTYDSHCVVWAVRSGGCSRAPPTGVGRLKFPGCGFESSSQRCGKHDGDVWEQKHHQRTVLARKWGQQGWGVPKQRLVCRSRLQRLRVPPVHGDLMVLPG